MLSDEKLSNGDSQVLSHIFDPESAPSPGIIIDASLPPDTHINDPSLLSTLKPRELQAIQYVESASGLKGKPKDGDESEEAFMKAYEIFSSLIDEYPMYASAFNNRAQLIRWKYGDQFLVRKQDPEPKTLIKNPGETAFKDLSTTIKIATASSPASPLSPSQAKLLAQAHTQRATLFYIAGKELKGLSSLGEMFEGFSVEELEEKSSRDFFLGGRYGNEVSKAMAVHTNPYAKMCGSIVKEAMRKEFSGGGGGVKVDVLGGEE